ncbi:MAG: class I SAM-dependent methyltransferase [Pyrinomonadaceae bacterium]
MILLRPRSVLLNILLGSFIVLSLLGGAFAVQHTKRHAQQQSPPVTKQQAPRPDADKLDRPVSEPYTGDLSIFEDPQRAERLQVERVLDVLQIKEGTNVADIGAGSGWFTVRAARRVGPTGAVYAVEINQDYLKHIAARATEEKLTNIRTVLGRADDPVLPATSVDAVLLLKTYHEIAQPVRLMRSLRAALRPGALVGIIDRNGQGDDHGLDAPVVIKELARAGYTLKAQYDFVKPDRMDYFLVFSAQ